MSDNPMQRDKKTTTGLPSRPAPIGRTLIMATLVFGVVLTGVIVLKNRDAASYTGYLQAKSMLIKAPFSARLESTFVPEGELVVPETPLFSLMDDQLERRKETKLRQIAILRTKLEQAQAQAKIDLAELMKNAENELLETKLKSANLLKEKFAHEIEDIAWSEYSNDEIEVASLQRTPGSADLPLGPTSPNDRKIEILLRRAAAQNANEVITSQVELCQRRMQELEEYKQNLPNNVQVAAGVESIQASLTEAEQEYQLLVDQLQEQVVTAPGYGQVGLYEIQPGQTVEEGDLVVRMFDQEELYVTVDIPSHDVHRYEVSDKLKLKFPNGKKSRGKIAKIAPHVTSPEVSESRPAGPTLVRLWIEPADALWPTTPIGSQIEISR
ncbi:MAG: HlyD family efflux transporter periplasmic adaptor subunit [Planctomycetaceae bacterium]